MNKKITDWLVEHKQSLEDLASYCKVEPDKLLKQIAYQNNKMFVDDNVYSILKFDADNNIALLKNDMTGMYHVVHDINKNYDGWRSSTYCDDNYDYAKFVYQEKTSNMNYEKNIQIHYLNYSFGSLKFKMKQEIINLAFCIQQKVDDEQGCRVTVDDLSCFIAKLVTENEYDKHYNSLNDSPINSMDKWEILDRFYSNNYKIL